RTASTTATSASCVGAGAVAGVGADAGAGAGAAAGGTAACAPAGAEPPPAALSAVRHFADNEAAFFCRQGNAPGPLGATFEQCAMKSLPQAEGRAFCCPLAGC